MIRVTKFSGESVVFEPKKLLKSLLKSGASHQEAQWVLGEVSKSIREGDTTKNIYKLAHRELKKLSAAHATRYHLKEGLLALGPTGYVFEQYIARLFEKLGYAVDTNQIIAGKCVSHEIDVLIANQDEVGFIECKFTNKHNSKIDVKMPLYLKSRWDDVRDITVNTSFFGDLNIKSCWLVSNQKFSSDAQAYANCVGMNWLGWDSATANSLGCLIDKIKFYPITSLQILTISEKKWLLDKGVLSVFDVFEMWELFNELGMSQTRLKKLETEIHHLIDIP